MCVNIVSYMHVPLCSVVVADANAFCLTCMNRCARAQVLEVAQPNSGRDAFSSLLKKQRLVKEFKGVADVGTKPNPDAGDYYTVTDFFVGATINVYGRQFFIYAVDEYVN